MELVATFFKQNIVIIYFFYGLSFFCMGLFVWVESGRSSTFRLARAMGPLAGFGIIHGLHEWIEMFQNMPNAYLLPAWVLSDSLRMIHLVLSFTLLIIFGIRLIYTNHPQARHEKLFVTFATSSLLLLWAGSIVITRRVYQLDETELLTAVDVLARYILGIPGAILAAWAIYIEQQSFRRHGLTKSGNDLLRAAMALLMYGLVGQIFVKSSLLFPSNFINSTLFLQTFGIPVQLFRAFAAAVMAIFVVRALRGFEFERQQNLMDANEARMAAQSRALAIQQQAQEETQRLNQDLTAALRDLTLLFDFSRGLATTLDRDKLVDTAVSHIVKALTWVDGAAILWQERDNSPLNIISCDGHLTANKKWHPDSVTILGKAVIHHKEALRHYKGITAPLEKGPLPRTHFSIGLPLMRQELVSGAFVLQINTAATPLSHNEIKLLHTLAGQLSIAIENATLYQEVQAREMLRGELLHQVVSAQEHERQRIARELHDGTGQMLTAMGLGFAAAASSTLTNPQLANEQLTTLKKMTMEALRELRDLIADLRPSVLDDLGLIPALQSQIKAFDQRMTHAGQPVHTTINVDGRVHRLHPDIETTAFRIIQEALNNVAKHAQATEVHVQLNYREPCLNLVISDNGCGFNTEIHFSGTTTRHAWGLLGMQERVALVGGHFKIQSQPGSGTTIDVCLPFLTEGEEHVEDSLTLGG